MLCMALDVFQQTHICARLASLSAKPFFVLAPFTLASQQPRVLPKSDARGEEPAVQGSMEQQLHVVS